MPEEQGIVVRLADESVAVVRTQRSGACEGCAQKGACHALSGAHAVVEVRARNLAGARVGDTVTLRMSDRVFLGASFAVYVVPVAAFILGAVGANALAGRLGQDADLWAFFGGVGLCGLSFAMVRLVLRLLPGHEQALMPLIVSRCATPASQDSCCLQPPPGAE
jgi:sigma-E factor negative regulatory protein RseC